MTAACAPRPLLSLTCVFHAILQQRRTRCTLAYTIAY